SISSPGLKGLGTPLRAGRAGRLTALIFSRPGRVNSPAPRFFRWRSIRSLMESRTALTCFLLRPVSSEMLLRIAVLVNFSWIAEVFLAGACLVVFLPAIRGSLFCVRLVDESPDSSRLLNQVVTALKRQKHWTIPEKPTSFSSAVLRSFPCEFLSGLLAGTCFDCRVRPGTHCSFSWRGWC